LICGSIIPIVSAGKREYNEDQINTEAAGMVFVEPIVITIEPALGI
jgi:hypothetical protein